MADEREEREAKSLHSRMIAELADLKGDLAARMSSILNDQDGRSPDSLNEESRQRAWVRGELAALQNRVDKSISYLR